MKICELCPLLGPNVRLAAICNFTCRSSITAVFSNFPNGGLSFSDPANAAVSCGGGERCGPKLERLWTRGREMM